MSFNGDEENRISEAVDELKGFPDYEKRRIVDVIYGVKIALEGRRVANAKGQNNERSDFRA